SPSSRARPLRLFFFLIIRRHPISPLFPYTTLFRSLAAGRARADQLLLPRRREHLVGIHRGGARLLVDVGDHVLLHGFARPQELRSEEHTSELQSLTNLVCRLLLEKKNKKVHHLCTA